MHTCPRCGRRLTSARSIRLGYGEACWRRMRAVIALLRAEHERELIGAFKPHQIDSAEELIELGGVVYAGDYSFIVLSTDGLALYTASLFSCNCPAGERGEECYHQAAVVILEGVA